MTRNGIANPIISENLSVEIPMNSWKKVFIVVSW